MAPGNARLHQEEEESATLVTQEQPKSSCTTYLAEGDKLFKIAEYKKAIESYTQALERADAEGIDKRPCFHSRALCKLHLGDSEAALEDAEESLEEDPTYSKGLWIKAEALYAMGNFEYALMFFHRGCHLRSDNGEFQIGIQKSQEAIENAIGEKAKSVELSTDCDLTYFYSFDQFKKREKKPKPGTASRLQPPKSVSSKKDDAKKRAEEQRAKGTKSSRKSSRRLLGELYSDKEYLEQLFKDGVVSNDSSDSGKKIREYTNDAIKYLEKREEFWRQQDPSRTHDKTYERSDTATGAGRGGGRKGTASAVSKKTNPGGYVIKQIEKIESEMDRGDFKQAEKRSKEALNEALIYTDQELADKQEFLATLYNLYGLALFEQDKLREAEQQFLNDLDLSETNNNVDGRSRALDNLGRVNTKLGRSDTALRYWQQRLELLDSVKNSDGQEEAMLQIQDQDEVLERTWLYHEIAKCHLDLKSYGEAKAFGQKALDCSSKCGDEAWQLNATIIVAKAEMKLEDYESASNTFGEALELAKSQQNKEAQDSIEKALRDVNEKLSRNVVQQVSSRAPLEQPPNSSNQLEKHEQNKQKAPEESKNNSSGNIPNQESSKADPVDGQGIDEQKRERGKVEEERGGGGAEDSYGEEEFEGTDEPGTVRESIER